MAAFLDPFRELSQMQREMARVHNEINRAFGGLTGGFPFPSAIDMHAMLPPPTEGMRQLAEGERQAQGQAGGELQQQQQQLATTAGFGEGQGRLWLPRVDVRDAGDALEVSAELPGVNKEDIKLEVHNGLLHLTGERRQEKREERGDYFHQERSFGRFHRALRLPPACKEEGIQAEYRDGVLHVRVPQEKPREPERKAISIV